MKMNTATKKKMAAQRLKRIIAYYRAYDKGSSLYTYEVEPTFKPKKYYVLSKHQLNDSHYFVLSDEQGKISIFKIVYNRCPEIMEVSKTSKKYIQNEDVFESWVEEEYNKRNRYIRNYYATFNQGKLWVKGKFVPDNIVVRVAAGKNQIGSLELKKEYNNNYYFVVGLEQEKSKDKVYIIAKIAWDDGYVRAIKLSDEEYKQNEEQFLAWLKELASKE